MVGHYTQLVWGETKKIGCGFTSFHPKGSRWYKEVSINSMTLETSAGKSHNISHKTLRTKRKMNISFSGVDLQLRPRRQLDGRACVPGGQPRVEMSGRGGQGAVQVIRKCAVSSFLLSRRQYSRKKSVCI